MLVVWERLDSELLLSPFFQDGELAICLNIQLPSSPEYLLTNVIDYQACFTLFLAQ